MRGAVTNQNLSLNINQKIILKPLWVPSNPPSHPLQSHFTHGFHRWNSGSSDELFTHGPRRWNYGSFRWTFFFLLCLHTSNCAKTTFVFMGGVGGVGGSVEEGGGGGKRGEEGGGWGRRGEEGGWGICTIDHGSCTEYVLLFSVSSSFSSFCTSLTVV